MRPEGRGRIVGGASDLEFGLATAVGYGSADYLAKTCTERIGFLGTFLYLEVIGAPLLVALALATEWGSSLPLDPLLLLLGLSVFNLVGTYYLYQSFQHGTLAVVSPLVSGYPALIAVLSVLVLGERLLAVQVAGIALVLAGVVLLSKESAPDANPAKNRRKSLIAAGLAFIAYGVFYFGIKFVVGPIPPITAGAIARVVTLVPVLALAARAGSIRWPPAGVGPRLVGVALLDSFAFLAYNFGVLYVSSLAVLGTVSGLFSAITVGWAVAFGRERLSRVQWAGAAAIFAGVLALSIA